jgi:hypothetical protein
VFAALEAALGVSQPARVLIAATAVSLLLAVAVSDRGERRQLLLAGAGGLVVVAVLAAAFLPGTVAALVLLAGAGQAALPGVRTFPVRLRGPAFAVALLTLGALVGHFSTLLVFQRLAAVLLALGLVAAVGALPFLQELAPEEPVAASPIAWIGFIAPALAIALPIQALGVVGAASGPVYGGLLVALGLVNVAWGGLGAWRVGDAVSAWRHSFLADWGLALVGLGLISPGGAAAAQLVLVFVIAVRLPLYVMAQPTVTRKDHPQLEPGQLLVAALLAGAAPFAGFPARLLLIKAASDTYWPLALVLVAALLLWLPGSLRLARTIGRTRGRRALGLAAVALVGLAIGLYPAALLVGGG